MTIVPSLPQHAQLIGKAVTAAIGHELASELAGSDHTVEDVESLFAALAARDDTQYSYVNSLTALDDDGNVMGIVVSYDGAGLIEMRRIFFAEAKTRIGLTFETPDGNPDSLPGETDPEEYYLDSLAVFEPYRGKGVARALITAARDRARRAGKPLGLLVDKNNARARSLYDSIGFIPMGEREFAGELMDHMVLE